MSCGSKSNSNGANRALHVTQDHKWGRKIEVFAYSPERRTIAVNMNETIISKFILNTHFRENTFFLSYDMVDRTEFDTLLYSFENLEWLELLNLNSENLKIDYRKFPLISQIDFTNMNCHNAFSDIFTCETITSVSFKECNIDTIGKGILGFTNLEYFTYSGNADVEYDFLFSDFLQIRSIGFDYLATEVPKGVCSCNHLAVLMLTLSPIAVYPSCLDSMEVDYFHVSQPISSYFTMNLRNEKDLENGRVVRGKFVYFLPLLKR
ncbi:MAG: hypothetical protein CVU11_15890 [Bacteroidetes bacterium HGW-Bacteroidetes-6]|nr:MAG: hypothetical protein CVU11_15890 [Bacteroidetes bacterium HGW-Bacteroidetes-6]